MSIRHVDARFALPFPVQRAVVLGGLESWRDGLVEAGVEVAEYLSAQSAPQLVVAPVGLAKDVVATGAAGVVIEGRRGAGPLRQAGLNAQRLVPTPSIAAPRQLIRTDHTQAARYAVEHSSVPVALRKRVRNAVAKGFLSRGRFPEVLPVFAVGSTEPGPPFFLTAAQDLGVPPKAEWFMTLGEIDPLSRSAFHVFEADNPEPSWIIKVARVPDYTAPFERDERGIRLATAAGKDVSRRVPRLLGRLEVGGLHASVEAAAVGYRVTQFLQRSIPREEKLRMIDAVADWIVMLGRRTSRRPLDRAERERLANDVVPSWSEFGIPADLVDRVPEVMGVVQHADLGSWNVIARDPSDFVVIDWESIRLDALPLWDLTFFLVDALLQLDGVTSRDARDRHITGLFRGEVASSEILFRWLRQAVDAFSLPAEAVGPIVSLCWLDHGVADTARGATRGALGAGERWGEVEAERIARLWVTEPGLGVDWNAWRA